MSCKYWEKGLCMIEDYFKMKPEPCPLCGVEVKLDYNDNDEKYYIVCNDCELFMENDSKVKLVQKWNKRNV
jgi:hypothetical protein